METQIPSNSKIETPRQEIEALKEKIRELETKYEKAEMPKESAEIKKEAIAEHVDSAEEKLHESYKISQQDLHQCAASAGQQASENDQVRELLNIAKEKGVINAFAVARALGNPHILDAFHDALVEHYDEIFEE